MKSLIKPGFTFWTMSELTVLLLGGWFLIHSHDPKFQPDIIPGQAKEVHEIYHFHKSDPDKVRVISPTQVALANTFGPKVYKYAADIRSVNNDNTFPSNKLLLAIAATESSFNKNAQSASSVGLLQINYKAHGLKKQDLFDVRTNVKHSVRILEHLHDACNGDLKCTVLSYNVGFKAYKEGRYNIAYYNKVVGYMNLQPTI